MTVDPVPAAAVQIAMAVTDPECECENVAVMRALAALVAAGWLHEPSEITETERMGWDMAQRLTARVVELEDAAQTVCAALDDAGRLHATRGAPELDALIRS